MWTAVLPVQFSLNSTFWLINNPKTGTSLCRWFKSNLEKCDEITSSEYEHINIIQVTISKILTEVLPV